jgi:hypothetical protein
MLSLETTMQSYYAQRAREYDRVYEKPERQADLKKRELRSLVADVGQSVQYTQFEFYWALEYVVFSASVLPTRHQ